MEQRELHPSPFPADNAAAQIAAEQHRRGRISVRLIIAIPVIFALVVIAYGYTVLAIIHTAPPERMDMVAWGALICLPIFVLFAIIVGMALAFSILAPIRSITRALEDIAKGRLEAGSPDAESPAVDTLGAREFQDVGASFDSMVQHLTRIFQARNRYMNESVNAGVVIVDAEGRIASMDPLGEEILETRADQIQGRRIQDLPTDIRHGAGQGPFFGLIHDALQQNSGFPSRTITVGESSRLRRIAVSLSVDASHPRRPSYIFSLRDVTRDEEMRRLLARTDQLAAMGAFAMGLAHELRNPLGSIKGMAQLLELPLANDETSRQFVGQIVREVDRMDRFVRELLEFGQAAPAPFERADLAALADEALRLARYGVPEADGKQLRMSADLQPAGPVSVQSERMIRTLSNLIRNALEAATENARILVATRREGKGADVRAIFDVENEGPTIPKEALARIFEPFYSTKPKGAGLGLAIAYQVVAQNGGEIRVQSADGRTRFTLIFPLAADNPAQASK